MIPGEMKVAAGDLELNKGRKTVTVKVTNTGDRPIQVGSHYHFFETNEALQFDRKAAYGCRLNIAAGTAVRFEPGQARTVELQRLVGLEEVVVRADLDRPVAGVGDFHSDRLAALVELQVAGGDLHFAWDHGMGLCTVTSLVPSGNVASTWMSGIISGTPSMTSARFRIVAP